MKEIISYDGKSLEKFIVNLSYEKDLLGIRTDLISPLSEEIGEVFPEAPLLGLLKRRLTEVHIGHLRYYDEEKINYVDVGQDFLVFVFNKYTRWSKELKKIIHVFNALNKYVEVPNITKVVLTYVDIFKIDEENFNFNDYFTFPIFNNGPDWDIKFHDINIGIVPFEVRSEKEKRKTVIRLRSRPQEANKFVFSLETVGSIDDLIMQPESSVLEGYLEDCHDRIIDTFLTILTDQHKEDLDLIYD